MKIRLHVVPDAVTGTKVTVTGPDHHYLFRVRRLRAGNRLELFDGAGMVAEAEVVDITAANATLSVLSRRAEAPAIRYEFQLPMIKGERMDRCISQLVELGARRVAPYSAERAVVSLDSKRASARQERHQRIARAAAQQCRHPFLPEVSAVQKLEDVLTPKTPDQLPLLLWEGARSEPFLGALPDAAPQEISVLTGPEGGLTKDEVELALGAGYLLVGLGPLTLRADTAPVAALAALSQYYRL